MPGHGTTRDAVDRFLAEEGLAATIDTLWADPEKQRLSALCYIEYGDRVLLLQRKKPPFEGYWTAPGGKLLPGEDPRTAIRREVFEETGLTLHAPRLRLVASETGPEHYNWLLFFFRATPVTDGVADNMLHGSRHTAEGLLDWLPVAELEAARLPGVEKLLLPHIFGEFGPGSEATDGAGKAGNIGNIGNAGNTGQDDAPRLARIRFNDEYDVDHLDVQPLLRR